MLSKWGWNKGSGLGATGSGIVNPLQVKLEKRKKRPDSEGGGFVTPAGRGKIIGSNKKGEYDTSKFGPMSEVVKLLGMVDGMDLDVEMEGGQNGGLMQEIGQECGDKVRFFSSMDLGRLLTRGPLVRRCGASLHRSRRRNPSPCLCQIQTSLVWSTGKPLRSTP